MALPKIFVNEYDKKIDNNKDLYYKENNSSNDIDKLKRLFDENGYANKINVNFKLKEGNKNCKLVLCKSNCFITIENEKIFFDDIINYEIKK